MGSKHPALSLSLSLSWCFSQTFYLSTENFLFLQGLRLLQRVPGRILLLAYFPMISQDQNGVAAVQGEDKEENLFYIHYIFKNTILPHWKYSKISLTINPQSSNMTSQTHETPSRQMYEWPMDCIDWNPVYCDELLVVASSNVASVSLIWDNTQHMWVLKNASWCLWSP